MLNEPTVFVIGAGAGHELNMPLGDQLSGTIANDVDLYFDHSGLTKGQPRIAEALRRIGALRKTRMNEFIAAGRMIASGIRYTRSIDNFIYTHSDKDTVKQVAKVAIVHTIISAERGSYLYVDDTKHPFTFNDEPKVRKSWMYDFFSLLQDGIVESRNLERIFDNLAIINFNYDRCVEHFLHRAMQELYPTKGEGYLRELINEKLKIIHPYGLVGNLPWQRRGSAVRFGGDRYETEDLAKLSDQIYTFNEQMADTGELSVIRRHVNDAARIVFLGFHFHKQNMELLTPQERPQRATVYATQVGRSVPDLDVIDDSITTMLGGQKCSDRSSFRASCTCKEFFTTYGVLLSA
jgi:hypothetical protein